MARRALVGLLAGFPLGLALGVAIYGGIGWLVAGQAGFVAGCAIAAAFAVTGLVAMLRFWRSLAQFERTRAQLETLLAEGEEVPF